MLRLLVIILCFSLYANNASAQAEYARVYTEEKPLIFEDSEAIWPYSFINDAGEPDGYCVDLLKILMRELEIPFEIRLKPHQTTLTDLQTGKADLILGLGDVYEEHYGHYGRTSVTLLTQSVATHKGANKRVNNFRDLKNQKVYVKDSSLCHHLMVDYGWGQNAIVSHDPAKALQKINDTKEGQMVWNTMTLQWLIDHYKLGGLTLSPVNMPHGETKFLSNDTLLLKAIDDTYFLLSSQGKLSPLEEKWFYPNHQPEKPHHAWIWALTALALVLLIGSIVFLIRELQQNQKATRTYHKQARRLSKMAENDKMRFWTYHIDEEKFEWFGENGMPITTYTADEFATRYNRDDHDD